MVEVPVPEQLKGEVEAKRAELLERVSEVRCVRGRWVVQRECQLFFTREKNTFSTFDWPLEGVREVRCVKDRWAVNGHGQLSFPREKTLLEPSIGRWGGSARCGGWCGWLRG